MLCSSHVFLYTCACLSQSCSNGCTHAPPGPCHVHCMHELQVHLHTHVRCLHAHIHCVGSYLFYKRTNFQGLYSPQFVLLSTTNEHFAPFLPTNSCKVVLIHNCLGLATIYYLLHVIYSPVSCNSAH